MTEFIEFSVKQVANRPAHLPKVQAPVHIVDGAPGVHHKRRPQGMTKMTQKYTELLTRASLKLSDFTWMLTQSTWYTKL